MSVARHSPLWPDFADASRLYMRRLMAFLGASFPPEVIAGARAGVAQLTADNRSLAAERLRGMIQSHRDWLFDDGTRSRLRVQWANCSNRSMRSSVRSCRRRPTRTTTRRNRNPAASASTARTIAYPDQLAWPGIATLPGLPATAIPLGLTRPGPAVGVQIVGPWLEDRTPLKLAELIERDSAASCRRRCLMTRATEERHL